MPSGVRAQAQRLRSSMGLLIMLRGAPGRRPGPRPLLRATQDDPMARGRRGPVAAAPRNRPSGAGRRRMRPEEGAADGAPARGTAAPEGGARARSAEPLQPLVAAALEDPGDSLQARLARIESHS